MSENWHPSANNTALIARAELLSQVRHFFAQRKVLEVETPLLCKGAPTDPHLASIAVETAAGKRFLQTSPEFAMKRLLAAGSGDIYQICKSFRGGESSPRHNPEFTMLEWYRLDFSLSQLIIELIALFKNVLGELPVHQTSYKELFVQHLAINPHQVDDAELADLSTKWAGRKLSNMDQADYLDLLMSQAIEPKLPAGICVVTDFPACQAALSLITANEEGELVAKRFEIYIDGMELANGYSELLDNDELAARFTADNLRRAEQGLMISPGDDYLLAAMDSGLPQCVGVAVGLDRLLMAKTGIKDINQLLSFPFTRA